MNSVPNLPITKISGKYARTNWPGASVVHEIFVIGKFGTEFIALLALSIQYCCLCQKAALLCMVKDDLNEKQRDELAELMKNLPEWKQKLGGKSLPIEKFVIQKAERFLKQGNFLVLPALELIYLWNGFRILGQSHAMIEPVYQLVEKAETDARKEKNDRMFFLEDICLITLLKGMCFKFMNLPKQAEECFEFVIDQEGQLITDTYLVLYAQFELALKMKSDGQLSGSLDLLEKIQKDKGHHHHILQLDLRIHTMQSEILAKINSDKKHTL